MKSLVFAFAIIVIAGLSLPAPNLTATVADLNARLPIVTTASYKTPTPITQNRAWFVEMTLPTDPQR